MRGRAISLIAFSICSLGIAWPTPAQVVPSTTITPADPLHRTQSSEACSKDGSSSCAAAAAKILPLVMGPSPMEDNLRRLTDEIGGRVSGTPQMARAIQWGRRRVSRGGCGGPHRKISAAAELERRRHAPGIARRNKISASHRQSRLVARHSCRRHRSQCCRRGLRHAEDFDAAGARIKGALLLVHTNIGSTWADLDAEYSRPRKLSNARTTAARRQFYGKAPASACCSIAIPTPAMANWSGFRKPPWPAKTRCACRAPFWPIPENPRAIFHAQ